MSWFATLGLKQPARVEPQITGRYVINGVEIINPQISRESNSSLVIDQGKIASELGDGVNQPTIDAYQGCYALPGLVDMHVHLPPDNVLKLTRHASLLYLLYGVTTVREAGDIDGTTIMGWRNLPANFPAPRVLYCGPFVGAKKRGFKNTILLETAADAPAAVQEVKRRGASFLKLYDGLNVEMIAALKQAAAQCGLKPFGHVPAALAYEAAGVPEVQHFFGVPKPEMLEAPTLMHRLIDWQSVTDTRLAEIAEETMTQGIENTPTLAAIEGIMCYRHYKASVESERGQLMPQFFPKVVWHPHNDAMNNQLTSKQLEHDAPAALEKKQRLVAQLHALGAPLYLGTDTLQPFLLPGHALQREMHLFAETGIAPEEVWRLATSQAGEKLGVKGLGRIEADAPADVLLFAKDPTKDLAHLSTLKGVIRDGRLYSIPTIMQALAAVLDYFRSPVIDRLSRYAAQQSLANSLPKKKPQ